MSSSCQPHSIVSYIEYMHFRLCTCKIPSFSSLLPVDPYLFHYIQFSKHLLNPYCVQGTLLIPSFCACFSSCINITALLEVKACVKGNMGVAGIYGNSISIFYYWFCRNISCYWGLYWSIVGRGSIRTKDLVPIWCMILRMLFNFPGFQFPAVIRNLSAPISYDLKNCKSNVKFEFAVLMWKV